MSALEVPTEEEEEDEEAAAEEEDREHKNQLETGQDQEEPLDDEELSTVEQTVGSTLISNKNSPDELVDYCQNTLSLGGHTCRPDYQLDSEYFSDPDFHDERPGKTRLARREEDSESETGREEVAEDALIEEEQIVEEEKVETSHSNSSIASCVNQELDDNPVESSSNEPVSVIDNDTVFRDLEERRGSDEQVECEQVSELEEDQVTASEARPELLIEETSAALDDICVHYSTSRGSGSQSDCSQSPSEYPSSCCEEAATLNPSENLQDLSQEEECNYSETNSLQVDLPSETGYTNNLENESLLELATLITDNILVDSLKFLGNIQEKVTSSSQEEEDRGEYLKSEKTLDDELEENMESPENRSSSSRKLYTSSMYYDDDSETYPTIEQQVELCRSVADTLTGQPGTDAPMERGSLMFKQRRERMRSFTLESSPVADIEDEDLKPVDNLVELSHGDNGACSTKRRASLDLYLLLQRDSDLSAANQRELVGSDNLTDTEYEAPQVRHRAQPRRATTTSKAQRARRSVSLFREIPQAPATSANNHRREQTQARFKPFLDSNSLKDIASLRQRFPPGTCNEHDTVPAELCHRLANELKGSGSDAAVAGCTGELQEPPKRCLLLESCDWILGERRLPARLEMAGHAMSQEERDRAEVDKPRPSLSEETVMVAEEAAAEQQVVEELAPEPVKHTQPQLELATVTKTASFMSSSRLVIECDSPDLLTSRDEEDEDEEPAIAGATTPEESEEPQQVSAAVRAESRQSSCINNMHFATLLEWRPRLMTPTLMVFNVEPPSPIEAASRCSSVVHMSCADEMESRQAVNPGEQFGSIERPFSVANMRLKYQKRLERLHNKAYSSYRYPFARSPADCLLAVTAGEHQSPHHNQPQQRRCFSLEPQPVEARTSARGGPQTVLHVNTGPRPATGAHLSTCFVNGAPPRNRAVDDGCCCCIGEPLGDTLRARRGVLMAATTHRPEQSSLHSSASTQASYVGPPQPPPPQGRQQVPTESPGAPSMVGDSCGHLMQEAHALQPMAAGAGGVLDYPTSRHEQDCRSAAAQDRRRPPAEPESPVRPCQHQKQQQRHTCAGGSIANPGSARLLPQPPPSGASPPPPPGAYRSNSRRHQCGGQEVELLPLNRRSSEALRAVLVQRPRVNYCAIINR